MGQDHITIHGHNNKKNVHHMHADLSCHNDKSYLKRKSKHNPPDQTTSCWRAKYEKCNQQESRDADKIETLPKKLYINEKLDKNCKSPDYTRRRKSLTENVDDEKISVDSGRRSGSGDCKDYHISGSGHTSAQQQSTSLSTQSKKEEEEPCFVAREMEA